MLVFFELIMLLLVLGIIFLEEFFKSFNDELFLFDLLLFCFFLFSILIGLNLTLFFFLGGSDLVLFLYLLFFFFKLLFFLILFFPFLFKALFFLYYLYLLVV